jgi:hypothetical protein
VKSRELLKEMLGMDLPPPKWDQTGDIDKERAIANRSAFTAMEFALSIDKRYHPLTWEVIKNSPFANEYRRKFNLPPGA